MIKKIYKVRRFGPRSTRILETRLPKRYIMAQPAPTPQSKAKVPVAQPAPEPEPTPRRIPEPTLNPRAVDRFLKDLQRASDIPEQRTLLPEHAQSKYDPDNTQALAVIPKPFSLSDCMEDPAEADSIARLYQDSEPLKPKQRLLLPQNTATADAERFKQLAARRPSRAGTWALAAAVLLGTAGIAYNSLNTSETPTQKAAQVQTVTAAKSLAPLLAALTETPMSNLGLTDPLTNLASVTTAEEPAATTLEQRLYSPQAYFSGSTNIFNFEGKVYSPTDGKKKQSAKSKLSPEEQARATVYQRALDLVQGQGQKATVPGYITALWKDNGWKPGKTGWSSNKAFRAGKITYGLDPAKLSKAGRYHKNNKGKDDKSKPIKLTPAMIDLYQVADLSDLMDTAGLDRKEKLLYEAKALIKEEYPNTKVYDVQSLINAASEKYEGQERQRYKAWKLTRFQWGLDLSRLAKDPKKDGGKWGRKALLSIDMINLSEIGTERRPKKRAKHSSLNLDLSPNGVRYAVQAKTNPLWQHSPRLDHSYQSQKRL